MRKYTRPKSLFDGATKLGLAGQFNVHRRTIQRVLSGETWTPRAAHRGQS